MKLRCFNLTESVGQTRLPMAALQVQFDSIRRPGGKPASKEVAVFRPHWEAQHEGNGGNGPVLEISWGQAFAG